MTNDIEADCARLEAKGVRLRSPGPVTVVGGPNDGGKALYLEDPDGNAVELCSSHARGREARTNVETGLAGRTALVTERRRHRQGLCRGFRRRGSQGGRRRPRRDGVEAASREIGAAAGSPLDVTDAADVERLVSHVEDTFGSLDVLVTCAGVFHATPFDEITPDEWDRIQAVNLKGTFLACQAAVKSMIPHRKGRIVTVASLAGQVGGSRPAPPMPRRRPASSA